MTAALRATCVLAALFRNPVVGRGSWLVLLSACVAIAAGLGNLLEGGFGVKSAERAFFVGSVTMIFGLAIARVAILTVKSPRRWTGIALIAGGVGYSLGDAGLPIDGHSLARTCGPACDLVTATRCPGHNGDLMNRMNFRQLQIFHTVARLGSFSKAAEELAISQPAVSIQVRKLEKSMASTLLHRSRSGLQLTDTGEAVFSYTTRIFSLADEMQTAVKDLKGLKSERLVIGSSTTPGEYILPWIIGQFQRRYPGIEVSLSITNTHSVVKRIQNGELDLGMAGAPVNEDGLASFPYVTDEIVVIASPAHALAGKPNVPLSDLRGQSFILRETGSATRSTAQKCLENNDVSIRVVMELGSNEAVKRAVAAGLGLGMISRFGVTPDVAAGVLQVLPVSGWRCQRPLTVFYRDDKHLPSAQQAFLHFLQEERPLPDLPSGVRKDTKA